MAWGRTGHHIVADIAMQYLPQPTKDAVLAELGSTSPQDAATWMDDMRVGEEYDYMKPWHYIQITKGESYQPGSGNNIITALNRAFSDIRDRRGDERRRRQALMILFHLIGDLHEPLNVGYATDNSGYTVAVNCDGVHTNLHHVWDVDIINLQNISTKGCLGYNLPQSEVKSMQVGSFADWLGESRQLLPQVYAFSGTLIDRDYMLRNSAVVEGQLLKAGIRLAYVLQTLFGADTATSGGQQDALRNSGAYMPAEAAKHIGETATVCGKVYGGRYVKSPEETWLYMGAAAPASPFSIVIIGKDRNRFAAAPEAVYNGLDVCVTGLLTMYKGKAAIVVNREEQIEIQ